MSRPAEFVGAHRAPLLTLRASLLIVCISIGAPDQTRTLALYLRPAHGLNLDTSLAMRSELQRLLAPAGLKLVWRTLAERKPGENFDLVAVSSFEGSCARDAAVSTAVAQSLADTSIANGRILPFFRIHCTRLIGLFGTEVEPAVLGRALARLLAHEIYHIVAQTAEHQKSGVAKAAFSIRDLTAPRFNLDAWSIARIQPTSIARAPETPVAASAVSDFQLPNSSASYRRR